MSNIRYDRYKQTYVDVDTGEKFPVIWVEQLVEDWDIDQRKMKYNFWKYCFLPSTDLMQLKKQK